MQGPQLAWTHVYLFALGQYVVGIEWPQLYLYLFTSLRVGRIDKATPAVEAWCSVAKAASLYLGNMSNSEMPALQSSMRTEQKFSQEVWTNSLVHC
jgi:hypothetical protein